MSKTENVRELLHNGDLKSALKIAKSFRIGVTEEQRSIMSRGYESIVHREFYQQLGQNTEENIAAGKQALMDVLSL